MHKPLKSKNVCLKINQLKRLFLSGQKSFYMTPRDETNVAFKLSSYFNFQGAPIPMRTLLPTKLGFLCISYKDRAKCFRLVLQRRLVLNKNVWLKTV